MAISRALQPWPLLLLSLFFLPAALGAFVNFTNCAVSNYQRRVDVTSVEINPHPFSLGDTGGTFTITANTTLNMTSSRMELTTYSVPLFLNPVRKVYAPCNVTACPVTPGPVVFVLPIFIPKTNYTLVNQSEYFSAVRMFEGNRRQIMCVTFRYPIVNWT